MLFLWLLGLFLLLGSLLRFRLLGGQRTLANHFFRRLLDRCRLGFGQGNRFNLLRLFKERHWFDRLGEGRNGCDLGSLRDRHAGFLRELVPLLDEGNFLLDELKLLILGLLLLLVDSSDFIGARNHLIHIAGYCGHNSLSFRPIQVTQGCRDDLIDIFELRVEQSDLVVDVNELSLLLFRRDGSD